MRGFRSYLVQEVQQQHIEKIKSATDEFEAAPEKAPFSHIFGDKARLRVPLAGDSEKIEEITTMIQAKMPEAKLDWLGGRILKYNDRSEAWKDSGSIASALSKMKADKKYLDWFAQYMSLPHYKKLDLANNNLVIVISRHPVDVLRMSDVGGISSCHSPEGSYFDCAIEDAQKGNLVAYLVRRDAKVPQNGEMFRDNDRLQAGDEDQMGVVARLRIRRFLGYYKDDNDKTKTIQAAIPEKRVYPDWMESFYQTVLEWSRKSQPKLMSIKPKQFLYFKQIGGHYFDTTAETLFRDLFDTDEIVDSIGPEGQKKMLKIGIEKLKTNYKLDHVKVETHIENDEVHASGTIELEIGGNTDHADLDYGKKFMHEKLHNYAFDAVTNVSVISDTIYLVHVQRTVVARLDGCERFFQHLKSLDEKYNELVEEAKLVFSPTEYVAKMISNMGLKYTKVEAKVDTTSSYYFSMNMSVYQEYHIPVNKIKQPEKAQEMLDEFIAESKKNYKFNSHYYRGIFDGKIENGTITIRMGSMQSANDATGIHNIIAQQRQTESEQYNKNLHAIMGEFITHETLLENTALGKAIEQYFEVKKTTDNGKVIYYKIKGGKDEYGAVIYFNDGRFNLSLSYSVLGPMMDRELYADKIQPELHKWITNGDADKSPMVKLTKIPDLYKLVPHDNGADYELIVNNWSVEWRTNFPLVFANTDAAHVQKVIHDFLYLYQERNRIKYLMGQWFWRRFNLEQHGKQHKKDYEYWNGPQHHDLQDDWKTPANQWSKPDFPYNRLVGV